MSDIRAGMLEIWRNELLKEGVASGPRQSAKALLVVGILSRFAMRATTMKDSVPSTVATFVPTQTDFGRVFST
jgi:hypothetical protein